MFCVAKLRVAPQCRVVVSRRYLTTQTNMSTLVQTAPHDDECRFLLILGKPGGGKGTISNKILNVSRSPPHSWSEECCCQRKNTRGLTRRPLSFFLGFPQLASLVNWRHSSSACKGEDRLGSRSKVIHGRRKAST